jgi:hypothetical protein
MGMNQADGHRLCLPPGERQSHHPDCALRQGVDGQGATWALPHSADSASPSARGVWMLCRPSDRTAHPLILLVPALPADFTAALV